MQELRELPARVAGVELQMLQLREEMREAFSATRSELRGELHGIRDELLDRFGELPNEARNLIEVIRLKILARKLGIVAIDAQRGELVLTASDTTSLDPQRLVNLMTQAKSGVRVAPGHKIFAPAPEGDPVALVGAARRLLANLGAG